MATLLDLLAALPEEAMREGASIGVADSSGREWTITFGKRNEPPQMAAWGIAPPPAGRWHQPATD
ncbi:hypothetical protein [Nocardioides aquiterrae]|uniref:Uncharacterized protein n=1 Tax=Nocardioides aquiterrae TaxID=203799 RepID=A0ABN1UCM0_9ACTN